MYKHIDSIEKKPITAPEALTASLTWYRHNSASNGSKWLITQINVLHSKLTRIYLRQAMRGKIGS